MNTRYGAENKNKSELRRRVMKFGLLMPTPDIGEPALPAGAGNRT